MNMIYQALGVMVLIAFISWFLIDYGADKQREKSLIKAIAESEIDIDIERQQNEIRSNAISDDVFINILRTSKFGELEN